MAYASAVAVAADGVNVVVTITETDADATAEVAVQLPFLSGRILKVTGALSAGTGTTIRPVIGVVTNPAGIDADTILSIDAASAAASINAVTDPPPPWATADGILYHRSRVDAGADNAITTVYYIQRGIA